MICPNCGKNSKELYGSPQGLLCPDCAWKNHAYNAALRLNFAEHKKSWNKVKFNKV